MKFPGNVAVITGGADGMGKALAVRLVSYDCSVALCDIFPEKLEAARAEVEAAATAAGTTATVSTHICNVADQQQCWEFARSVAASHKLSGRGLLVFNNAGVATAGSMITDSRSDWETTFNTCWGGVYLMTRAFMPLLLAAPEGYLINTSSVNGIVASLGFLRPHTAYSAAKFAVKGFTEALINDFKLNAPHIKAACVMPGHIGTGIAENSNAVKGGANVKAMRDATAKRIIRITEMLAAGHPQAATLQSMLDQFAGISKMTDAQLAQMPQLFRYGGTTPLDAADIILAGVQAGQWRILVGEDAIKLDEVARSRPIDIYDDPSVFPSIFSMPAATNAAGSSPKSRL